MRLAVPLALAFAAGLAASPLLQRALPDAHAQAAPSTSMLTPMAIDIGALKDADLPATPNPEMRSKGLVATDQGTIGVQSGNVAKHIHAGSDEIQYIVEGSGTGWLGERRIELRPGMLLIIPKGTPHGGTEGTGGARIKALAIKLPPQAPTDTKFVD